ncbi:NUDIX domain-containing protein [Paracoccus sp. (in: a-proteobacteria)]|uniref:NUDIX domain-containing protein n=1 Tax=Paracoccus sp. TaxID=267 RepID=UPI003A87BA56
MTSDYLLVGPLADPALCGVLGLAGDAVDLRGTLVGGARAGIEAGGWPQWRSGEGALPALRVTMTPALARYAAVMGLRPIALGDDRLLGVQDEVPVPVQGGWLPTLAAEIAALILQETPDRAPEDIARRLPMIGVWAESRLRGRASIPSGGDVVARRDLAADVTIADRTQPFAGFFAVEEWRLAHRTHAGGFTPDVRREGFVMGDAVVVLPWDPVRDRVLVIEQFRFAPALRCDPQPWQLEAVAGRIDAGETAGQAALREAQEEAALTLTRLVPTVHHYPSPGAVTEFLYMFIGVTDLPDDVTGVHGLDSEAEDIRGHLLERADLTRMVFEGQISNGPLVTLALWLELRAAALQGQGA